MPLEGVLWQVRWSYCWWQMVPCGWSVGCETSWSSCSPGTWNQWRSQMLTTIKAVLKTTRWLTGSQCRSSRSGAMCSLRRTPAIIRAAMFCTDWSFWIKRHPAPLWRNDTSRLHYLHTYLLTYLLMVIGDVANRQVTYDSLSVMYSNCTFNN